MICPGCGAGLSKAMVGAGECGYCHTALPKTEAPKVVHVTNVEVKAPEVNVTGLFDSVTARVAGCFSGCLSMGFTLLITGMILAYVAWQLWLTTPRPTPTPTPAPSPPAHAEPHPEPDRGGGGRRRK